MNSLSLETLIHSSSRALVIGVSGGGDVVGALEKALPVIEQQADPARIKAVTERTSRNLLHL
jgi:hypothetical protein